MRRREFIAALSGAAAMPFAARAQQAMPVVGFLRSTSLVPFAHLGTALRQGLAEAGFVEGATSGSSPAMRMVSPTGCRCWQPS